jgi:TPR repeat protein
LADEYHHKEQQKEALVWYQKAAELGVGEAFGKIGNYHMEGAADLDKDCQAAYEWFEKAEVREVKLAFNNHAWYLATSNDKKCRNPEKALAIYYKMKSLYDAESEDIPWSFWDTEAAILAAVSDFSGAVKLQKWLIEELKAYNADLKNYQLHLDQYLLRKPWIEK